MYREKKMLTLNQKKKIEYKKNVEWPPIGQTKQQQQQQTYHPNKLYIDQCYVL